MPTSTLSLPTPKRNAREVDANVLPDLFEATLQHPSFLARDGSVRDGTDRPSETPSSGAKLTPTRLRTSSLFYRSVPDRHEIHRQHTATKKFMTTPPPSPIWRATGRHQKRRLAVLSRHRPLHPGCFRRVPSLTAAISCAVALPFLVAVFLVSRSFLLFIPHRVCNRCLFLFRLLLHWRRRSAVFALERGRWEEKKEGTQGSQDAFDCAS